MKAARISLFVVLTAVFSLPALAKTGLDKGTSVRNLAGKPVAMAKLLRGKKSLVVFYRGHF